MGYLRNSIFIVLVCYIPEFCCDTNYRLNTKVIPSEYEITIFPHYEDGVEKAFTFEGAVTIKVATYDSDVNQIQLHSDDLEFSPQDITIQNGNTYVALNEENPLEFNEMYTFVYINLATPLEPNTEYEVNIVYKGSIRSDMRGLYRSQYVENGETKWLLATFLWPVHARNVFPCFDEPALKARFKFNIDRPENYAPTLTNTKLQLTTNLGNGYLRERFFPTPVMSTYVLAILISEFGNGGQFQAGDEQLGIWVRPEATDQSKYAFDFGKRVVTELGYYFGVDYYSMDSHLTLNHVGLPDFSAGAMENWGLITYREPFIMYDPSESTPHAMYRVAQIVAHETVHMWFGNLVTCHWFSDAWLNEGFANYFQDYITSTIEPELGSADLLVTASTYQAYVADEVQNPAPMTNNDVNSPADISGHFGTITYQKGGSVIRMIHNLIGDEAFRYGLNQYLNTRSLGVATPQMLYSDLDAGVNFADSMAIYPEHTVAGVMSAWVSQAGHPVLNVKLNHTSGEVILTQNRFFANNSHSSGELYPIPITYTTQSESNFDNIKPAFIMVDRTQAFGKFSDDEWIIFNVRESGFYRVNYDDHLWSLIRDALRRPVRAAIHHLNRAKIVNDLFALARAEQVTFHQVFEVLEFLAEETHYSVWVPSISGFNAIRNLLLFTSGADQLEVFALRLLENVIDELGFDERLTDNFVTLRNRMQISDFACKMGHQRCVERAVATFRAFVDNGIPVPPSLRPVAYCYGLKHGTAEDFDIMYQRKITTNVVNEALVIETALGCTPHHEKLQSYLEQMVSSDSFLRDQDVTIPLTSVLSHPDNFQVAFEFLQQNYLALRNTYATMPTILSYFPSSAVRASDLAEFEEWIDTCSICQPDEVAAAKNAIQSSKNQRTWTEEHLSEILESLRQRNRAMSTIPSIAGLILTVITLKFIS